MRREHVLSGGAPMPEQLVIEPLDEEPGLRVSGELDLLTVPQLREALARVRDPSRDLVLDFAAVTFVDSSGLGLLLSTAKTTKERGASLVLRDPSPTVRRLFGIAIPDGVPGLVVDPPQVPA
jgi:anti-anti-sigma factor